jgi:hypothetical protein
MNLFPGGTMDTRRVFYTIDGSRYELPHAHIYAGPLDMATAAAKEWHDRQVLATPDTFPVPPTVTVELDREGAFINEFTVTITPTFYYEAAPVDRLYRVEGFGEVGYANLYAFVPFPGQKCYQELKEGQREHRGQVSEPHQ